MKEEYKDLQKHGGINIKDFTPEKGYLPIVDLEEKDVDLKTVKKFSDFGFNPSENLKFHLEKKITILDNVFRPGSQAFYELLSESRKFIDLLSETDRELFESTDIGEFAIYEGEMVPLDLPMEEVEEINESEYQGSTVTFTSTEEDEAFKDLEKAIKNWHKATP